MVSVGERMGILPQSAFEVDGDDGMLRISRVSIFTGRRNEMVLPIDRERFNFWFGGGGLIQDIFPDLTPDQREFLMSGATPEEWADVFGGDDE